VPISVVNLIPNSLSNETNRDSEPNLAVNPANPLEIAASAFTPDPLNSGSGPIFVSTDGGATWVLNVVLPGGNRTVDVTVRFGGLSGVLYAGILRFDTADMNILRKGGGPGTPGLMEILVSRANEDQPWVEAETVPSGPAAGLDRVYVGHNDFNALPASATVEVSLDAATAPPPAGFVSDRIESRSTSGQDGPSIRPAIHQDGIVYAAYFGWRGSSGGNRTGDVVVVRDDNWASGATPFTAITDPSDGLAGVLVAPGVSFPFNSLLGTQRVGSQLAIAVDPRDSDTVYVAWGDGMSGASYTLHLQRSSDGGVTWSGDLRTVVAATNPCLAINQLGTVAFVYQRLVNPGTGDRWQTHLERSVDGFATLPSDAILADVPDSNGSYTGVNPIGDYACLLAVGNDFYGVFSGNNTPDLANFPNGVSYQRNADFATQTLLALDNVTPVAVSIDPFFFHVSEEPKTHPSSGFAIQGGFGTKGNFEVVAQLQSVRLAHFWRDNDTANLPWQGPTPFGSNDHYHPVALIQSNFSTAGAGPGNLEVIARTGNRLDHYWRDDLNPFPWHGPFAIPGANGVQGPALIQGHFGTKGNFEVVAARLAGQLAHFSRDTDAANLPWSGPTLFGSSDHYDAVALIQSNFSTAGSGPGNLEVIAHTGNRLDHYWRNDVSPFPWHGPFAIPGATGTAATPTLIQGGFGSRGNFEVVVPLASGGLAHFWRDNDDPALPWHGPTPFGSSDVYDAVALIQSNFSAAGSGPGNLEVIAHTGKRLDHYWRDDVSPFLWHGPFAIPGATGIG